MSKYFGLGLFICNVALAQEYVGFWPIESFRLQATGTIEDDIDWALDPIDIQRIAGYRVYTSLSNLITYKETPLGENTANQYLLGFSGPPIYNVVGFKSALLIEKDRLNSPNDVQLIFLDTTLTGKGFIKAIFQRWLPPSYTDYQLWEKSATDEFSTEGHVYFLNNSFSTGSFTIGLASPFLGRGYTYTTAGTGFRYAYRTINPGDESFEDSYKYYDGFQGQIIRDTRDRGNFLTVAGLAEAPWVLSVSFPLQNLELQGHIGITPFKFRHEVSDSFSAKHDSLVGQIIINYFDETELVSVNQKEDGKIFSISGAIRRELEEVAREEEYYEEEYKREPKKIKGYIEGEIGIGFLSGGADSTFKDNFDRTHKLGPDTLVAIWTSDFNDLTEYEGGISGFLFHTGAKGVIPISDNVLLGVRIDVRYQKTKKSGDTKEKDIQTLIFNDGDQEPSDPNDFVINATITEAGDITTEENIWSYRLPIGLEYKFTKNRNWAFRIGAIPSFRNLNTERIINITNPKITTVITTYGDGSADTTTIRDDFFPTQREGKTEFTQFTQYTYGLGWYPTQNLQIDLLTFLASDGSFLDLSTYRNLRLSITLKF